MKTLKFLAQLLYFTAILLAVCDGAGWPWTEQSNARAYLTGGVCLYLAYSALEQQERIEKQKEADRKRGEALRVAAERSRRHGC